MPQKTRKKQTKLKDSRRKELAKVRIEINGIDTPPKKKQQKRSRK